VFPKAVQKSGVLGVPAVLILGLLLFWLGHLAWAFTSASELAKCWPREAGTGWKRSDALLHAGH